MHLLDTGRSSGLYAVLHLHGFDNDNDLPALHYVSLADRDLHDDTRHGRFDSLTSFESSARSGSATDFLRRLLNTILPASDKGIALAAIAYTGVETMSLFQRLNADGITIVIVTHEPEIVRFARRILRFRDGRLIGDEVVEKPKDAEKILVEMPVEDTEHEIP